ncbi:AraC family transcriptional regulator [Bacillus cereus]|nr:AraC family transcriptional regulator [Bacillus cereus]
MIFCMSNSMDLFNQKKLSEERVYFFHKVKSEKPKSFLHPQFGIEFYYHQQGEATYNFGGEIYHFCPGDLLIFNREILDHVKYSKKSFYSYSTIHFSFDFIKELLSKETADKIIPLAHNSIGLLIRLNIDEQVRFSKLFTNIIEESENELFGHDEMLKSYYSQFLLNIYRNFNNVSICDLNVNHKELYAHRVLNFIHINFRNELTLDLIAGKLHLNKYYMCHCFKEVTSFTINKYLTKIRIDEAKKLLQGTDETIINISQEVGIKTPVHFSRIFKQEVGISPNKYRKSCLLPSTLINK